MDIKRAWMIPLLLGAIAAGMAACGDGGGGTTSSNPSGTGASGGAGGAGSSSSGSGGTGAGPMDECTTAADCSGSDTYCGKIICTDKKCGVMPLQAAGTPLPSQAYGDCKEQQCDDKGDVVEVAKDDDAYNDGKECTVETCMDKVLMQTPAAQGQACTGGICDGVDKCVGCLADADCMNNNICTEGKCVPATCNDATKDGTETDVDCGGSSCLPCGDGLLCTIGGHCKSGVCASVGGAPKTCQAPTCMDGKKNGKETEEDCGGGDCTPCSDDLACFAPTDCMSKVCKDSKCAAPTCGDAVQNGDETGVDCGGSCPNACP